MFHLKPKQSKSGITIDVKEKGIKNREVFVGTKTIVAFLIFTISGVLVGRSMWEYGMIYLGLESTTLLGLILFIVTGLVLHKFKK